MSARSKKVETSVRRVDVSPTMAVEVATYPGVETPHVNFRMLQLRIGNRVLWTWSRLTSEQAREIASQLTAAADDVDKDTP